MQPLHDAAAQTAANSTTGAPAVSAPQTQSVPDSGPAPVDGANPVPVNGASPQPVEGACPEPVEGACPEPAEGACPEPAEGACPEPAEGACPEPVEGFTIHPSAAIFPPMREAEFEALVADIREKGQLEAIWTWQGQVIDGRHRVLACQRLGLKPKAREWDGQSSLLEFIVSANLRRRHLKENQRAMVAARMIPLFEEEALERKYSYKVRETVVANLQPPKTTDLVGEMLSVSGRSVSSACRILERGTPDLVARVDLGKLAVSTAEKLVGLAPDEQQRLLSLPRRELAAKLRPAKPGQPAPAAKLAIVKEDSRDKTFIAEIRSGTARLKRRNEGLCLKLSVQNWRSELSELTRITSFATLLDRGFVIFRSDDAEK